MQILSNVVPQKSLRKVQKSTLEFLDLCLRPSFGPDGSNTTLSGAGKRLTQYTKDGKSILNRIDINGDIESTVKDDIYEITRNVVKNVGDGTTSAIILSHLIFSELMEYKTDSTPFQLMREFQRIVDKITQTIRGKAKPLDLDGVYNIALVSTNGNERFAESITEIYKRFGMDVFIDVSISTNGKTFTKEYNGLNLDVGYMDSSFVNSAKNLCIIKNPQIYSFIDPVNTMEQMSLLDKIINDNIMTALKNNDPQLLKPTVILVPSLSRDMSMYIDNIISMFSNWDIDNRLPFCIVSDITQQEQYQDLIKMLGCKPIQKAIDPEVYREMVEKGMAPTIHNVAEFFGTCEEIVIDAERTKFINPAQLRDEEGEYTNVFKNHLKFLETELRKQEEQGATATVIGDLKRRIQSLKANLVEFHIGGITAADRDSVKDLVEDAVLNIRSASKYGYGLASNTEALIASRAIADREHSELASIIHNAYRNLIKVLYTNSNIDGQDIIINDIIASNGAYTYDVFKKETSDKIITSIETDCAVLEGISKIVTLLFTSNQYLCASPAEANRYRSLED